MKVDTTILRSISDKIDWSKPQWLILEDMYNLLKGEYVWTSSISLGRPLNPNAVDVIERISKKVIFWYQRNISGPGRDTSIDRYGLVGLSCINPDNPQYVLTEGVSDFLTLKMCYPELNVLGFTTLGGNIKSTKLLLTLSDEILFVGDNDLGKDVNTGLTNALKLKKYYESQGKKVTVALPTAPHKDITQQVFTELKQWQLSQK